MWKVSEGDDDSVFASRFIFFDSEFCWMTLCADDNIQYFQLLESELVFKCIYMYLYF